MIVQSNFKLKFEEIIIFFHFCPNCTRTRGFSRHTLISCPFCRFSTLVFLSFCFIFSTPSWKWRPTMFVLELMHLFWWSSGHSVCSVKKKIAKLLKKSERWPNKWPKVKTLEDKPRSGWPFFHKLCEKYYRKSCKYMRNNSTKQKGKKISTSHYRSKFRAQQYVESLEEKKAVHPSCKHGVRRICQLYTKGGPAGKLMWCEPPRDHLDYRRRDNIQRSSPQNIGRAKTVTTLRLKECDFGHALGARTFYTSPLRKCQKTYRETFWLLVF